MVPKKTYTEAELINGLQQSNREIFQYLFRSYYPVLYSFTRKQILDTEAAKDILQEVFAALWNNRKQIQIHHSLNAYLFSMARNHAVNYLKKHELQQKIIQNLAPDDTVPRPDDLLQWKELQDEISRSIAQFPPRQKEIFQLSRQQGLKHREIANMLNLSTKTIETHLFRSMKELKDNLKKKFHLS